MTIPDLPDNYPWMPGSERYPMGDLGEHAVRLGSPVRFDRRGEVLWYDQFEYGLAPYRTVASGTGASVKISIDNTFMSAGAALLTAGSDGLKAAELQKSIQPTVLGQWGFELAIAFLSDWDYLDIIFSIRDGTTLSLPQIRLSLTDAELQYRDSSLAYQKIATIGSMTTTPPVYRLLKFVFDVLTGEYVYLRFGPDDHDLSGKAFKQSASVTAAQFYCLIRLGGRAGQNDTAQVGHVIFTANEP